MRSSRGQTEDNGMAHPPADDGSHLPPIEVTRLIVEIEPGADPVQGRRRLASRRQRITVPNTLEPLREVAQRSGSEAWKADALPTELLPPESSGRQSIEDRAFRAISSSTALPWRITARGSVPPRNPA